MLHFEKYSDTTLFGLLKFSTVFAVLLYLASDKISIKLSTREFTILEYMIRNKERVLSREQIEQHIWNYDYEGGTNVIDVYIRYLRRKIDKDFEPKLIHTIRGVGLPVPFLFYESYFPPSVYESVLFK